MGGIQARIFVAVGLDSEEVFAVKHTVEQVAQRIDAAHANNRPTVTFNGRGDKEIGFMVSRIVRWEAIR